VDDSSTEDAAAAATATATVTSTSTSTAPSDAEAISDADVVANPNADVEPIGIPLLEGDVAVVTTAGHLFQGEPMTAEEFDDWYKAVESGERTCFGADLPTTEGRTATAQAARTIRALRTQEAELTELAQSTPTPQPTTLLPSGKLTADREAIAYGECTNLRWLVTNAMLATLDEEAIPLTGVREVCPPQTTTYTLRWSGFTGTTGESAVTIQVTGAPSATPGDAGEEERPDDPAEPEPTATGCTPCAKPTRRPSATNPPLPTKPPQATPEPPTEQPTESIATEPPTMELPTEPPATEPPATDVPEPADAP
jgi:hypothetical protein